MSSIDFSRDLIKGRIAEVIFEQMMRDVGEFTVIPFGYEHTMPMLAQYQEHIEIRAIIDNISDAPDFVLISHDKKRIFLVEVKYRSLLDIADATDHARKLCDRWKCPWLFIATPAGFYFSMSEHIIRDATVKPLEEGWASADVQQAYLKLLNEFRL